MPLYLRVSLLLVVAVAGCSSQRSASFGRLSANPPAARPSVASPHVTTASWYGPGFNGHTTSSGETFDSHRFTAASRALPLGSYIRVRNLDNGESVVVRVNDRGPFVRGRGIDLSQAAAERLGFRREGVARVELTRLDATAAANPRPPLRWSGSARLRHYHHRHYHHPPRLVRNPLADWLLELTR